MELTNVKSRVVGVDIGVAVTTYAVVDLRGNIIAQDHFSTLEYPNLDNYLAVLCEKIINLVEPTAATRAYVPLACAVPVVIS